MEQGLNSEKLMIRYLLGELSAEEQIEMETAYLSDPERFNLLQAVEYDLVEGYISGKLSAVDRARFERQYLTSPARREHVHFFETLARAVPLEIHQSSTQVQAPLVAHESIDLAQTTSWGQSLLAFFNGSKWAMRVAFASVILILATSVIWQMIQITRLRQRFVETEQERALLEKRGYQLQQQVDAQRKQNDQLAQDLAGIRQSSTPPPTPALKSVPTIASLAWVISGMRNTRIADNEPRTLRIQPNTDLVKLSFQLPTAQHSHYSVTLRTVTGEKLWDRSDVKARRAQSGALLALTVPAKRFQKGTYSLVLSGINTRGELVEIGEFYIEVDKQRP